MTGPTVAIVAVLVVVLGSLELRRRGNEAQSMQGFRDQAKAESIEFTARDKQTTVESADPTA
jgi:Sec-independent protein translocase protein TatA